MMATPIPHYTEIERGQFEAITPSQFIRFTVPNTLNHRQLLDEPVVRVSVCDSPLANADDESPVIAAMIVPKDREADWNYTTKFGLMQLLFKFRSVSRLILIANSLSNLPPTVYKRPSVMDLLEKQSLENELKPLLMPLHPKVSSNNGLSETLFLTDEHDMAYRVTSHYFLGRTVGAFLVEDVELVGNTDRDKQLRRRLRLRRMPYLVQSEALLIPILGDDEATTQTDLESLRKIKNIKFEADTRVLVHPYLIPMVSGLFLIASHLNDRIQQEFTTRALCLGVGGGVLLSFLDTQMGFEVTGVEIDQLVIDAAKKHFGLNKSGSIRLIVGDAIETIQNFPPRKNTDESEVDEDVPDAKFDVVFVDLDSSDAENGFNVPPPEFVKKPVFEGLKLLLHDHGVVIINVVPFNEVFYKTLVKELKEVFHKVYEIDVGNEDNFVVMATVSPTSSDVDDNEFLKKLKSVIPGTYLDSIVEL